MAIRLPVLLLLAAFMTDTACSHRRRPASLSEPPADVTLQVTNHNFLDVTVFVLYDVEGYPHQEIATMLGISSGTSKAQLHRARMILRRHLTR